MVIAHHPLETLDDRAQMVAVLSEVLTEVGSEHALIGGIAVGYHGRLRATIDVDLLVPRSKLDPLGAALESRGHVVVRMSDMLRVYTPGADPNTADAVATLEAREADPVLDAAAAHTELATVLGHQVRIVPRGALVALKFHAAVSSRRAIEDRYQDVADIGRIIAKRFDEADEQLALDIAANAYDGARDELRELIDDLRNGRRVKI